MTRTPAAAANANRLSTPVKPSRPVPAGMNWSTEPPPTRRLRSPALRNRVSSELFAGSNRYPGTPALPGLSGPRSKLSPAKSSGITGPGGPARRVIVTGRTAGRASAGPGGRSRHREKNGILSPARAGTPARRNTP